MACALDGGNELLHSFNAIPDCSLFIIGSKDDVGEKRLGGHAAIPFLWQFSLVVPFVSPSFPIVL